MDNFMHNTNYTKWRAAHPEKHMGKWRLVGVCLCVLKCLYKLIITILLFSQKILSKHANFCKVYLLNDSNIFRLAFNCERFLFSLPNHNHWINHIICSVCLPITLFNHHYSFNQIENIFKEVIIMRKIILIYILFNVCIFTALIYSAYFTQTYLMDLVIIVL